MQKEHLRTLKSTQKAVEDTQQLLVEVLKTHQETQQKHEKDHREIRGDVLQIKEKVESLEERRSEDKESEVLNKKLAVVDTDTVIQNYAKKHEQGTRKSILEKVKLWLEDRSSENRVLVLSGNAGMGKSVIAAVVCTTMDQESRLAGCHFCQHNKARGRKPQVMLQSLARKLCDVLPKYKTVLAEKLSGNLGADINSLEVGDLFELLFEEPLSNNEGVVSSPQQEHPLFQCHPVLLKWFSCGSVVNLELTSRKFLFPPHFRDRADIQTCKRVSVGLTVCSTVGPL